MGIAALITWLSTAAGGFVLLGTWITKGGTRQSATTHLPPPVVFGHFLLAVAGLVVWIAYLVADTDALAWTAFALLVPVALLGFTMLARWLPVYRDRATPAQDSPAERHFPVAIVGGHGVFAVATVVLVLLTALGVGGS
ncbi:hypothetical protein IU486_06890 [Streptomyces gardneri]|uniref:hypothetical protein n=1 Tax=Nocardia TaxID=1817 RepID=UPI001357C165|nr:MULTISPECIES: hypothetical protein [Nocardia]MBF6164498.1 hypothetical protein [Streptomyces gardneri]MBF6204828.1 hypothetical protein [Streptomyces gardneri]UAK33985.1 hypothetical protein K8O92_08825 [Nocardia asteroides]